MSKIYRKDLQPACKYCRFCFVQSEDLFLCKKRGPVHSEDSCRRFKYDPFKRVPESGTPKLQQFSADDFIL